MKRLLVSACLAGLALSGARAIAAETTSAATGTDTLAATDKATLPTSSAETKPTHHKVTHKLAKVPLPLPRPAEAEEAEASASDGTQPAETVANAAPSEASTSETADAIDRRAVEAEPKHISTGHPQIDALVATHAKTYNVPEALIHRVIVRESKYQKDLVGSCGCIGLMQIKLGTARGLGYGGDAQGLHDANTNLTYGVKYLAGAYRAANGNHDRAVQYFAKGYYDVAKRQRLAEARPSDARSAAKLERARAPLDIMPRQVARASKHAAVRAAEAQAPTQ